MSSGRPYGAPATRRAVLDAARVLVAEQGGGLNLGDVARRAGVSRQAVYLHFRDRAGLLMALVQHMDDVLDLGQELAHVSAAGSGAEVIRRAMALHAHFSAAIDPVALVLEGEQYRDADLGAAWRNRMTFRRQTHLRMVERIAELGELSERFTPQTAADLFYAVTLPGVWRETVRELGWSPDEYAEHFSALLEAALLRP